MIRHILSSERVRAAALCCMATFLALTWTTIEAIRPPRPRPAVPMLASPALPLPTKRADTASDAIIIEKALDHDPFSATRQRPALADAVPSPTVASPTASTPDVLRLVGTVVDSSGDSFVLCQLGADPTHVLRIGQALGAYQLHSVSQGVAIFVTGSGQRLELRVPKTGS